MIIELILKAGLSTQIGCGWLSRDSWGKKNQG